MDNISFTVFHVGGGGGGVGVAKPVASLGKHEGNDVNLYFFEADFNAKEFVKSDAGDNAMVEHLKQYNINAFILPYCLSDHIGVEDFYINVRPKSSSLFRISKKATNALRKRRNGKLVWKDWCKVREVRKVNVTTLDELLKNKEVIEPDFLSMDAQGSEYSILLGASNILDGDLLGIITEVEFRELYEGQPLFADQDVLLRKNDFEFIGLISYEHWYSHYIIGRGELRVGEAMFLRDYNYFINKYSNDMEKMFICISKLAVISLCMKYTSHAYGIIYHMKSNFGDDWDNFILNSKSISISGLNGHYDKVNEGVANGEIL